MEKFDATGSDRVDIQRIGFYTSAISTILVHVLLCMLLFDSFRFTKKVSGICAALGFTILNLPQFFWPQDLAHAMSGLNALSALQILYWTAMPLLQYGLICLLTKRRWLHNLFLFMVGDLLVSVLSGVCVVLLDVCAGSSAFVSSYGEILSDAILVCAAAAAAFLIRRSLKRRSRLSGRAKAGMLLAYTLLRIVFTALGFTVSSREQAVFVLGLVLSTAVLFSGAILAVRLGSVRLAHSLEERCWRQLQSQQAQSVPVPPLELSLRSIEQNCADNQINHAIHTDAPAPSQDDKRLVCLLDSVSRLLIERCVLLPQQRRNFALSIQHRMHHTIVSMECSVQGSKTPRRLFTSVRQSFQEILLNRMLRECNGQIEFLDDLPDRFQVRFIYYSAN